MNIRPEEQAEFDKVKSLYEEGMPIREISRKVLPGKDRISKFLKEINIFRTPEDIAIMKSKDMMNYDYMDNIDTPEKAYFFGFFVGDGHLDLKDSSVYWHLSSTDLSLLVCFGNNFGVKPNTRTDGRSVDLRIYNRHLVRALQNKDIHQNKTYLDNRKVVDYVPCNLINHFLRGLLDADGWISIYRSNDKYKYELGFVGDKGLMYEVNRIINIKFNLNIKPKAKKGTFVYQNSWQSLKDIVNIGNWLYKDATIYLERKHEKYLEILRIYNEKNRNSGEPQKEIICGFPKG